MIFVIITIKFIKVVDTPDTKFSIKAVILSGTKSFYATLIKLSPGSNIGRGKSRSLSRQEYKKDQDHRITQIRPPPYMEKAYSLAPELVG